MEYTALYRKMRPKTFSEVCGQEHIVKTLKNQLIADRVSHAYLFCGTRGTGKTSTAKIFAKAINCLDLKDGEPCNECEMCKAVIDDRSFNIFEIDAASNNGVDNIRELREEVAYPPAAGKYKVYIIDEVHMLSLAAFNALLKTLEEPPAHVVFILATTDPQKVPVTILSRCQRFDFKRISPQTISDTLRKYMLDENVSVTDEALNIISGVCDGAMRDALSILDRCISFYYGEEITKDKVLEVIGSADKGVFFDMTDALCGFDTQGALSVIERVYDDGKDLNRFVGELVVHLRNVLLAKQSDNFGAALDYSKENIERLVESGKRIESARLIELISAFSQLLSDMKYAENAKVMLEVFTIKITNPTADEESSLISRIEALEKAAAEGLIAASPSPQIKEDKKQEEAHVKADAPKKATPEDIKKAVRGLKAFRKFFTDGFAKPMAINTSFGYLQGDKLYVITPNTVIYDYWFKNQDMLKEAFNKVFDADFNYEIILTEDYNRRHNALYGRADSPSDYGISEDEIEELKGKIPFDIEVE